MSRFPRNHCAGFVHSCIPLAAQTITASLEGDIKDGTGASVPGAQVRVVNTDTGVVTRLQSAADGRFAAFRRPG